MGNHFTVRADGDLVDVEFGETLEEDGRKFEVGDEGDMVVDGEASDFKAG